MESSGGNSNLPAHPPPAPVIYDFSAENEDEIQEVPDDPMLTLQKTPSTLEANKSGRCLFPVLTETFDLSPRLPAPEGELEGTFPRGSSTPSLFLSSPIGRSPGMSPVGSSGPDRGTVPSISLLVHSSMETPKGQWAGTGTRRRLRTPFTATQRLQEDLYDSVGEKPNNLEVENQVLYRTLDDERKRLILRKGFCSFMYGALKVRGSEVEELQSRVDAKTQECAARLILHSLLLGTYRKVQEELSGITAENVQLNKNVENLCLQLRVVRHLHTAEKERVVEKIHDIGTLKSELAYVKKLLNKGKKDLEKVEQECEALEKENVGLAEAKGKMGREIRCLQEKKEILQGSLEMEKKRSEKQTTSLKELKRQVAELRQQMSELTKQCEEWEERSREFGEKNWDLQLLLDTRGSEVIELTKNRDTLSSQAKELEKTTVHLQSKNEELEVEMKKQQNVAEKVKESLDGAESQLGQQYTRIGYLEDEIERMTRESLGMRSELGIYQGRNIRRRRSWVNWEHTLGDPLGTILSLFFGRAHEFIR